MGLKRKASALEDFDTTSHLEPYLIGPATPSLTGLSSPSSASTTRSTAEDAHPHHPYNFWRVDSVPYLNCRTRKRHRDGRPDEEAIHENTLKKLYTAQRLHLDEAMPTPEETILLVEHGDYDYADEDADMVDDGPGVVDLPRTVQRNQRTIDAFFGRRDDGSTISPGQGRSQTFISTPTIDLRFANASREPGQPQYENQTSNLEQSCDSQVYLDVCMDLMSQTRKSTRYLDLGTVYQC
ncbi:hypothetical protein A1O3_07604 [Capronia epimyces CBS 606.96]|uniref:Uncharacterized protein n=1 Tax=Capronia epimyces CBS 606.96 TaxID=1182542 RepID=W9YG96_9EURO|nr:uncharacterized protein A1O3_07604 [Capronia epimyces CBS 606.96]EXJ81314.1 hypothetical protein A1O3_07604 [Capronia epimyces CBS 606.96]